MDHYYTNNLDVKSNEKTIIVKIGKETLKFKTDHGVFSKDKLDFGTRTLLENLNLEKINGDVLDLGCGYGPIGIYLSKAKKINVDMIDINERSLELAKKNVDLNKTKASVFYSDKYENISKKYDFIVTNPPIRIGKKDLFEILINAKNYLKPNGELWFVINKDQGAKSTIKEMEKHYKIEIIGKNKGFYVLIAKSH